MVDREAGETRHRTEEPSKRKAVAVELVSLDGVMESPEEWAFSYSNDETEEANAAGMARSDALLLGRVTYEQMAAFWPEQPGGTPMVDYINAVPKFVVSGTLEEPLGWNNSTLICSRPSRSGVAERANAKKGSTWDNSPLTCSSRSTGTPTAKGRRLTSATPAPISSAG
jgi:hypothetical protein